MTRGGGAKGILGGAPWQVRPNYKERLLTRILANTRQEGECLIWQGPFVGRGYGKVGAFGKTLRAHRVVWELRHGPITDGLMVCHTCDHPACLEDKHHFLGTSLDNNRDMMAKGRARQGVYVSENRPKGDHHYARLQPERLARGESSGMAKLTEQSVRAIRQLHGQGWSYKQLAERFGVTRTPIALILTGKTWRHVA